MARPLRIEFPGALYHLTSRGNERRPLFLDNKDRNNFLALLSSVVDRFNWLCHAYCLMDNHYHILIETPEGNLSRGMRQLNGVYTQLFNRRYQRVGHLFQGRYKAILIDKDSYLVSLCRYVVLNSVRANLVKRPEDWPWSSYTATIGKSTRHPFLTVDWMLSQFNAERKKAIKQYKDFVLKGLKEEPPWKALKGQILLGEAGFLERVNIYLKGNEEIREIPKAQRYATRPSLDELFTMDKRKDKTLRNEAIVKAYTHHGYTLQQIAQYLGLHYATVSRALKQTEKAKREM